MVLKRIFAALAAVLLSATIAHAVISGIKSDSQDQQVSIGQLQLGAGTSTGTNTPTINNGSGVITTAALSTASGATQAITLTNNRVAVGDQVYAVLDNNGSAGQPILMNVRVTAGQIVFNLKNIDGSVALNAAVVIYFHIVKAGNPN